MLIALEMLLRLFFFYLCNLNTREERVFIEFILHYLQLRLYKRTKKSWTKKIMFSFETKENKI